MKFKCDNLNHTFKIPMLESQIFLIFNFRLKSNALFKIIS